MLKSLIRRRPKHLLAIYIEPARIEILWAHRHFRAWQVDLAEQFPLVEGESAWEHLQRLSIRPKDGETALVLFLSRHFYSFHREFYPLALKDQLEETLTFDWPENLFYENGQMLHFHGTPIPAGHQMVVPIFSLQQDVYDRFYQASSGESFQSFTIIPSATRHSRFVSPPTGSVNGEDPPIEITGRQMDPLNMEVNRFIGGILQDSVIIRRNVELPKLLLDSLPRSAQILWVAGPSTDVPKLLLESLPCIENDDEKEPECLPIHLVSCRQEDGAETCDGWMSEGLTVRLDSQDEFLVSCWTKDLLEEEEISGFGAPIFLKPWVCPKSAWVIVSLILLYCVFAAFKANTRITLNDTLSALSSQRSQLEAQWKPIEELQNRIPKLQEGQRALEQFGLENYPTLGLLTLLTQATPEDTWLNYFAVKGKEVTLRGESPSAIRYLSDLSKIPGFEDVRFGSPVSKNPTSDKERFHIMVQLDIDKFKKSLENLPAGEGMGHPAQLPAGGETDRVTVIK